jgi:predicted TIM-barrel fold metal-dependent hydrolase
MPTIQLEDYRVVDVDTHVSEPEDLWTSRVSTKKWGDNVPHVVPYEVAIQGASEGGPGTMQTRYRPGERVWMFAGEPAWGVAMTAVTGWKEQFPSHPPTLQDAHAGAWMPEPRLRYMDEEGIYAQVIYPNVGGFGSGRFIQLKEPELMYDCVKAYNDFLAEWCATGKGRLIPVAAMPFWDVDLCVQEIKRVHAIGHKGIVWGGHSETYGLPRLPDPHWDPVWSQAEDLGMSVNFHIDGASARFVFWPGYDSQPGTRLTRHVPTSMLDNVGHVTDMILSGVTFRHPKLNIVAVESGVGWIPFMLEMMDWQWKEYGCHREHPDWDLTPSEYFQRQCYGCFWAETYGARAAIGAFPDNCLFETDFPHPVSLTPSGTGLPGVGGHARDHVAEHFGDLAPDVLKKVLHDNAAKVYHLD